MSSSESHLPPPPHDQPHTSPNTFWNQFSYRSFRNKAIPIVTKFSHGSAPFLSTFLLIHLSAPIVAGFDGSELSSKVMLLGREYYQTSLTEPLLLWAPLGIHIGASMLKRLLISSPTAHKPSHPLSPSFFNLLTVSAYTTTLFLPIHILIHRYYPTSPSPPIYSLGPSELDYEFIKYGLKKWPVRSMILYTGVVMPVLLHAVEGMAHLWKTYASRDPKQRSPTGINNVVMRRTTVLQIGIWILGCMVLLWKEPMNAFPSLMGRFNAIFRRSLIFRLL